MPQKASKILLKEKLNLRPFSQNYAWRYACRAGRLIKYLSSEYSEWLKEALIVLKSRHKKQKTIDNPCSIDLVFGIEHPKQCDLDNFIKCTLDLLQKAKLLKDDRLVYFLKAKKIKAGQDPYIEILVRKIKPSFGNLYSKNTKENIIIGK